MVRLETGRLVLRHFESGDSGALIPICNSEEMHRFTNIPFPYGEKDAAEFIAKCEKERGAGSAFHFALVRKEDNLLIGACAVMQVDAERGFAELGFMLGREHRGKGYMEEALRELLDFAFSELKLRLVGARIDIGNKKSIRLMEKLGAEYRGKMIEKYDDGRLRTSRMYSFRESAGALRG